MMLYRNCVICALMLATSTNVFGGKPNQAETFGGKQRFSFGDHATDGILSDLLGEYVTQKGRDGVFSEITDREYRLHTDGSSRTLFIDFSQVTEGDASRMPASGLYEFRLVIKAGLATPLLPGEIRSGSASVYIDSQNDDRYYALHNELIVEAVDSNQNGVVDTLLIQSTGRTLVQETEFLGGWSVPNGNIGSVSAPFSATIIDAELN